MFDIWCMFGYFICCYLLFIDPHRGCYFFFRNKFQTKRDLHFPPVHGLRDPAHLFHKSSSLREDFPSDVKTCFGQHYI